MYSADFDVIVVGGGPAGVSAAIPLAKSGMNVLLVDRAEQKGTKSVSGGVLWGNDLEKIILDWNKEAPIERKIIAKRIGMLTETDQFTMDYRTKQWENMNVGYSVLRVKFDSWLLKKAEESGVFVINGSPIEKLAWNNGRVTGIIESGEVTTANSVIVADGANSRIVLNEKFGGVNIKGKTEYPIENMALGIKEVYKLDEKTINDRFNITYPYGVASEYLLGFLKNGVMGGGFLYTNKESISLGVVINLPSLKKGKLYSYDIIEDYKTHPFIAPLIEGGSLVEYSAHLIPEGGPTGVPKLAGNGYLVVGDAASLCYSNGVVIQGMNYAIRSGMVAAETLINAKKNNWVDKSFQEYIYRLKENHLLEDIEMLSHVDRFSWNERLHHTYPYLITDILNNFIGEHGNPKKHIRTIVKEARKKQGISNLTLMRDMLSWGWRL